MSDRAKDPSGVGGGEPEGHDPANPKATDGRNEDQASHPGDYEVGYRRPPKRTRFVKGQSGNPRGRPKGTTSFSALIAKNLDRKIVVRENGRERKAKAGEVIVASLTNKAMKGDLTISRFLFERLEAIRPLEEAGSAESPVALDSGDWAVIDDYFRKTYGELLAPSPEPKFADAADSDKDTSASDSQIK